MHEYYPLLHAGGIISAALDGERIAEAIVRNLG